MSKDDSHLVYTTDIGRRCPQCQRAITACVCKGATKPAHGDGIVRVSRETKGRGGKGVTLVSGVPIGLQDLEKLATQLKKRCGTGGTVKEGVIEIQGEHRDTLMAELTKLGYKVKRVGG